MHCGRCTAENDPAAKFCRDCGAPLAEPCPACGHVNAGAARFCNQCGRELVAARAVPPVLEDERKQVTILFADVKASLELLADRDPEEARKILDPVLERMMAAVREYGGTVNQVLGDGIMALFGAPIAQEDHAVRACYAALGIQAAIRRYAREHEAPIEVRIGLNSDEVVLRSIGGDLHRDYTAVGLGTHLAARMEQLARPGAILATQATAQLAEAYVAMTSRGHASVKGLGDPVEVYEVTGIGTAGSRLHAAAARGLTPFVGRQAEMGALRAAVERVRSGHGALATIVGEPGVGKSRLLWEFVRSSALADWHVLVARTDPYARHASYRLVVDLLRASFGLPDDLPRDAVQASVLAQLEGAGLANVAAPVLSLLDLPVSDAEWSGLDPAQRRRRVIDAVRAVLRRQGEGRPLCVVVEDLQWVDAESEAVLDSLVTGLADVRALVVVTQRPEYTPPWRGRAPDDTLAILPLSPGAADALLRALIGDAPALADLRRHLSTRTSGNPFFLEESVRHLVETRALVRERGEYRLADSPRDVEIPPTVYAVLAARIDRLPVGIKHVLQAAAVIGHDVSRPLLQEITRLSDTAITDALTRLQAADLLAEADDASGEYTFKHALTLDVAYRGLLKERRTALDAAVVAAIEKLHGAHLGEHVERLAHHSRRGEVWAKALEYSSAAGHKAFARSAHRSAVRHLEEALLALSHLPSSAGSVSTAIDLRLDLRNALLPLGEFARAFDHLREAEQLAIAAGDRRRHAWAACHLTVHYFLRGDYEHTIEYGERARALGAELGEVGIDAVANLCLGQAHHSLGSFPQAIGFLTRAVSALQGPLVRARFGMSGLPSVAAHTWLVWCCSELGEFEEGLRRSQTGLEIAESVGEPWSVASATFAQGLLRIRRGDLGLAVETLGRGLDVCRAYDIRTWLPPLASALGYARALAGDLAPGIRLLEDAVAQAVAIKMLFRHSLRLAWLGEALMLAGALDRAEDVAREAVELARRHHERGHEAYALRTLAAVTLETHGDPATRARALADEALALATTLGMRPLVALCHELRGEIHRRQDDPLAATRAFAAARDLASAMGMTRLAAPVSGRSEIR